MLHVTGLGLAGFQVVNSVVSQYYTNSDDNNNFCGIEVSEEYETLRLVLFTDSLVCFFFICGHNAL